MKVDLLENRQQFRLTLRKEKLEDLIMTKRQRFLNSCSSLEIDINKLIIPQHIVDYAPKDVEDAISQFKNLLSSRILDEVKYGINKTRKFTIVNNDRGNNLIKYGLVDIFINLLETSNENEVLVNYS